MNIPPSRRRPFTAVATRLHITEASRALNLDKFNAWCRAAEAYSDVVLVAVDAACLEAAREATLGLATTQLMLVSPWDGFIPPLNAVLLRAMRLGATRLLTRSLEIDVTAADAEKMQALVTESTLVVGAKINSDHGGAPGIKPINGMCTPWNTFALWNVNTLRLTGFPMVCDAVALGSRGVEEVATISLLQHLLKERAQAHLIHCPGLQVSQRWDDPSRAHWHRRKMASKIDRADAQLREFGVPRGTITVHP